MTDWPVFLGGCSVGFGVGILFTLLVQYARLPRWRRRRVTGTWQGDGVVVLRLSDGSHWRLCAFDPKWTEVFTDRLADPEMARELSELLSEAKLKKPWARQAAPG